MTKKIYISGKITGMVYEDAFNLFEDTENMLKKQGFDVVNPMKIVHDHDKSWHSYMKEDIKALCDCDEIYMLSNWIDSKGAIIEHRIALDLGITVKYQ